MILFVGVNGVGKRTRMGKVGNKVKNEGKRVILAGGDRLGGGGIEEVEVWGEG
ncbi:P-loop NTPase family protein [Bacillus pumilus]|uniref:hypothetical protein n=1 Tax=Bacillus pumilus TaxID=1408 RepID=UPI00164237A8|nr:hypothetical protein [Bacillus pumilus]